MASNELPPSSAPPIVGVTTRGIEGQRIAKYIGIVGGETILGVGFERDFIAGIKNFTGARVTEWEDDLQAARYTALTGMMQRAASCGAKRGRRRVGRLRVARRDRDGDRDRDRRRPRAPIR